MEPKRKQKFFLLVLAAIAASLAAGWYYLYSVQNSLWNKAVTDILEVTAQGRHALDTYVEKDQENLQFIVSGLEKESPEDGAAILERLRSASGTDALYVCVDLENRLAYTPQFDEGYPLQEAQTAVFEQLEGERGIREPFINDYSGVWTIGNYQRFAFADGTPGYAQKTQPLKEIAERFSLTFYGDTGFSYVVNQQGNIMIRSLHPNSNRTFQNLFDIIDLQGNDPQQVEGFRAALENGKRGAARFRYQQEDYVFCYVPMETIGGWYVVSIVPDRVIMEQADTIMQNSQIFFFIIVIGILVLTAFFLVSRDSARQVLKAEEKARRAAESANLAKSQFLSNMSHDIRTPMNAIVGMARLASDHAAEPDKVKEYLKNISMSGQLLVGLINDILDLSKIESGKMALNNSTASLEQLMTELVNIIQPLVQQRKQAFEIRLHGIRHEILCFDSLRLNQILLNLLSNATKFTPEEGEISVDVTETPSQKPDCAHFTFRVADSGIGMKPEFVKNLFESFTREKDSRVDQIEGSGLGMAITKMIVDMMGGEIRVESEPGRGTVFTVELDLQLACEDSELPPLPALRLLVADDDPATCRSAESFLRELGVQADVTESGRAAVEKALAAHRQGRDYDLVLLDWKMPGVNGIQAVRAIRRETGCEVPVIIFSAYDWARIEREATEAGVTGFIQKPFFKSTLYRCILQYVLHKDLPAAVSSGEIKLAGKHILMAEDNELNQEITRELLENTGAEVEIVNNGKQCVERFARSAPRAFDLILMDVQMPVMNGYEAARQIRAMARADARTIPIFAITADAFAEDVEAAKQAGMNSHLAKPLDIPHMMREIQKYLHA